MVCRCSLFVFVGDSMSQALKEYANQQGALIDFDVMSLEVICEYVGDIRPLSESEKKDIEAQLDKPAF